MESIESLKQYCSDNNRAVPIPDEWNRLFQMLKNTRQKPTGGWEPGLPLILHAWWDSTPAMKVSRFSEHLEWANQQEQIDEVGQFIRSLKEEQWAHYGELP